MKVIVNWHDIKRITYNKYLDITRIYWINGRIEEHNGRMYAGDKPVLCGFERW